MLLVNASRKAAALSLITLFLLSCTFSGHPHRRHHPASKRPVRTSQNLKATTCDFDADFSTYRAILLSSGFDKKVTIHFGDARSSELAFATTSLDSGSLVAGDIDRDGDVDLVWVGSSEQDSVVLINQGRGDFAAASDSAPYASELGDLFSTNESPKRNRIKRGRRSSSLLSGSFHDVGLPRLVTLELSATRPIRLTPPKPSVAEAPFVCYLRKRGPPAILS